MYLTVHFQQFHIALNKKEKKERKKKKEEKRKTAVSDRNVKLCSTRTAKRIHLVPFSISRSVSCCGAVNED